MVGYRRTNRSCSTIQLVAHTPQNPGEHYLIFSDCQPVLETLLPLFQTVAGEELIHRF